MAGATPDEPSDAGFRRSVRKVRERAFMALMQARDEQVSTGSISRATRRELASATLAYRDRLKNFQGNNALEEPWAERGVDWIEQVAGQTVTVSTQVPRSNGNSRPTTDPALLHVPPSRLIATLEELDEIAGELNFEASTPESTTRTEITNDLLEEVEQWRKRNLD